MGYRISAPPFTPTSELMYGMCQNTNQTFRVNSATTTSIRRTMMDECATRVLVFTDVEYLLGPVLFVYAGCFFKKIHHGIPHFCSAVYTYKRINVWNVPQH